MEEKRKGWWGQTSKVEDRMWEEWIIEIEIVPGEEIGYR